MNDARSSKPKNSTREGAYQLLQGRYEVCEQIGVGGMGEVFRAWDRTLKRDVAIKRMKVVGPAAETQRTQLLEEGRAASAVNHPGIVHIYDVFEEDDTTYLVEELVKGVSLRTRLGAPLPLSEFKLIATECAEALAAASNKGIVHCDLKPDNILLTADHHPRILDFGIARHLQERVGPPDPTVAMDESTDVTPETKAGGQVSEEAAEKVSLTGTPAYLSPERIAGQPADGRADVFALGIIFYEMLTGRHPFRRKTTRDTLAAVVAEAPSAPTEINPELPPAIDPFVMAMLEKDPNERLGTPREVLEQLAVVLPFPKVDSAPPMKRRVLSVVGFLVAILVLSFSATMLRERWQRQSGPEGPTVPYIMVQPFDSLTDETQDAYFARGMTEVIQARLARLDGVQVVDSKADVGARYTLEGSLQRSDDELRITCKLMDRQRDVNLAGVLVEGQVTRLFALQDELTAKLAAKLAEWFDDVGQVEPAARPTADVTAYDYYLQARGYLQSPGGESDLLIAVDLFNKALDLDSGFVLARAGTGEAYWALYLDTKEADWAQQAEEIALETLESAPDAAEVHKLLGTVYRGTGESERAVSALRRALSINPRDAESIRMLAWALYDTGETEEAEQAFLDAIALRPSDWGGHSHLGTFYYYQQRIDEARLAFLKVVELTPDNARGYRNLAGMLQLLGQIPEALAAYERSLALAPDYRTYSNLARLYTQRDELEKAAGAYEKALAINDSDPRVWGNLASLSYRLDREQAYQDSLYRRAVEKVEGILAVNPNNTDMLLLGGQYNIRIDEPARATELIERALALSPDKPEVLFQASCAYEFGEDRPTALSLVRRAIEAGCSPDLWYEQPALEELVNDPAFQLIVEQSSRETNATDP